MFTVVRKDNPSIKIISNDKKPLKEIVTLDEKISFNIVEAEEYKEKITAAYNRIYYITQGEMDLYINGNDIHLEKGDACFVEKGTRLELHGTFTVIIVSSPPLYL